MNKKKFSLITIFALAGLSGVVLLYTSQNVQLAEERLARLEETAGQEKESIRVLNAEWAYLNNPERIEKLSAQYLSLKPFKPEAPVAESSAPALPEKTGEIIKINSVSTVIKKENPPMPKPVPSQESFNALLEKLNTKGTP